MLDALRRLLRDLSGRGDEVFVGLLHGQVEATGQAADLILAVLTDGSDQRMDHDDLLKRLDEIEQRGDECRAGLVEALAGALTTPIDREDLFRVSRSVDDVLDNLHDFGRELQLYEPPDGRPYLPVLRTLSEGLPAMRVAIDALLRGPAEAVDASHAAKQVGNELRARYQEQVAALFEGSLDMGVLKHRELLRRLDVVGLRFGEAADALADGALKRGQ